MELPQTTDVARLTWEEALTAMAWTPGQHVTLVGPTEAGKTELAIALMRQRNWTLYLATKRLDPTADELKKMGHHRISTPGALNPEVARHFVFQPKWFRKLSTSAREAAHTQAYSDVLTRAFWQTGWTVVIDELEYINRDLNVTAPVNQLLRAGRSQGNSMILGTQRPRYVTLHAYEQATHLFLWRQSDWENVKRAAEFTGLDRSEVVEITRTLDHHDTLYVRVNGKGAGTRFITNTRW